jgi:antitoxin component HigA of HigAB toxin-antitoxin module
LNEISPIPSEADYEAALVEVKRLWGARSGTPEGDRLDALATFIAVSPETLEGKNLITPQCHPRSTWAYELYGAKLASLAGGRDISLSSAEILEAAKAGLQWLHSRVDEWWENPE